VLLLARLVRFVTGVVVAIIVVGILLVVFEANMSNTIVSNINDAARWLVGPFKDVFSLSNPKTEVAVNWGLAALVYSIVGGIIASLLARAGLAAADARDSRAARGGRGWGRWRRRRAYDDPAAY
jgi:hypothetical protein